MRPEPQALGHSADPLFVDAANGDYHIRFGSPAMDTGTSIGAPTYDKHGVLRPQGSGVDMGAYEAVTPILFESDWTRMTPVGSNSNWGIDSVDVSSAGLVSGQFYRVFVRGAMHSEQLICNASYGKVGDPY